jgi:DNA-binding LacI/PurR family transcriptional regulator
VLERAVAGDGGDGAQIDIRVGRRKPDCEHVVVSGVAVDDHGDGHGAHLSVNICVNDSTFRSAWQAACPYSEKSTCREEPTIPRTVTLLDVAEAAGVSIATASRALAGKDRVSRNTIERVRLVAAELGYRVDPIARALREGSTRIIGMIVPVIANPFYAQLVDAVEAQVHAAGFELLLADSHGFVSEEARRLQVFGERKVDGVVIVPSDRIASLAGLRTLPEGIAVVQLDRSAGDSVADFVGVDNQAGFRLIFDHLVERGAERIAYAGSDDITSIGAERWEIVHREAERTGRQLVRSHRGEFSIASGTAAAEDLLAHGRMPDAVVAASDLIAIGLIARLREADVQVPRDLLVTGFDGIELSRLYAPSITTVVQPVDEIARDAITYLVSRIQGAESSVRTSRVAPTLQVGQSTSR